MTFERDELPELPAASQLAAYRTVQEALTNVLKHAPGSSATVRSRRSTDSVQIVITNASTTAGAPAGCGRGLIGMRQRLELVGGTLATGPDGAGTFRVQAQLPVAPGRSWAGRPGPDDEGAA